MWELILSGADIPEYKSEHPTQGAAFARLKMLYPHPENMRGYLSEDYTNFVFTYADSSINGSIYKKSSESQED